MGNRPLLRTATVERRTTGLTASVELGWSDRETSGMASGGPEDRLELVARATLRALESHAQTSLRLVGTNIAEITSDSVAVTVVQVRGSAERFAGSAVYRDGEEDLSVARSVLDALNRFLTRED